MLTAGEMNAHNSFESPDAVKPAAAEVRVIGGTAVITIPAKAVVKVEVALA